VGRAEGANIPEEAVDKITASRVVPNPDATTSMLVDLRAGRPIEADGMTGAVVRIGARHGIETPDVPPSHRSMSNERIFGTLSS
jgi:2-dehydropantoate 2-reductase